MIISRTPLRISFVGGGSDLPTFYRNEPGAVVSTTIKKYIYITLNTSFDGSITVRYSKEEKVRDLSNLEHNLVREALRSTGVTHGVDISSTADVPSKGSGLGSSSAYLVGVLHALHAYKNQYVSAEQLAKEACTIEIEALKKPIGKQDQYIVAYGGFRFIQFNPDEGVNVDYILCHPATFQRLERRLLLFYTGITRSTDRILSRQNKNMNNDLNKKVLMRRMVDLAREMRRSLEKNRLNTFGDLLHENWVLKKQMAETISSAQIDQWYEDARKSGAIGGKLLGAGGGGYLLFYAPESSHARIIRTLRMLPYSPVRFENHGSKIIYIE